MIFTFQDDSWVQISPLAAVRASSFLCRVCLEDQTTEDRQASPSLTLAPDTRGVLILANVVRRALRPEL